MKRMLVMLFAAVMIFVSLVSCTVVTTVEEGEIEHKQVIEKTIVESAADLFEKKTKTSLNLESVESNVSCVIDLSVMGESEKVVFDVLAKANVKDMLCHTLTKTTVQSMDSISESETYSDMTATYTKDVDGRWFKHENDLEDALENKALLERIKTSGFDAVKYIENIQYQEAEYDGKECYKLTYTLNLKLSDMLKDLGQRDALEDITESLAEEFGPEIAFVVTDMFSNLGSVDVVEYVDVYTLYTLEAEFDMTTMVQALADKIIGTVISMYGEGMTAEELDLEFAIREFAVKMTNTRFNETEVVIPQDVLAAPEFDDDYGTDVYEEYYDDLYEDDEDYDYDDFFEVA